MRPKSLLFVLVFAVAGSASADIICSHKAPRRVAAPAAQISRLVVIGHAGSLRVAGRKGATEIVATGTACTDDADLLPQINLKLTKSGSELRIEAVIPGESSIFGWNDSRLDFEVALPDNIPVTVDDGSGSLSIENVATLQVDDGSGELVVKNIHGNASIKDGSGSLTVADVSGNVAIEDGSGSIEVDRVGGSVVIDDGSGSIVVRNVQRDFTVRDDGSGSIEASDIRGNFTVEHDGSGGIDYARVAGKVSIPKQ